MTTAERLRRRQIRESVGIAVLAICLFLAFVYFRGQDAAQDKCLSTFVETQTQTSSIRSGLVERESAATRGVIRSVSEAENKQQLRKAFHDYFSEVRAIDRAREDNPIRVFPEGLCN